MQHSNLENRTAGVLRRPLCPHPHVANYKGSGSTNDAANFACGPQVVKGEPVLDLDYPEDSKADTDMNVIMGEDGGFIEVQGTAEGEPFTPEQLSAMLALAAKGVSELCGLQQAALAQ